MDTNAFDGVSFIWGTSVAKPRPWHLLDSGTLPCTFCPTRIAWPRALLLMDLCSCPNMSNLFVSGGALPSHRPSLSLGGLWPRSQVRSFQKHLS